MSLVKKLTAHQRLTTKKQEGIISITSEEVEANLRNKDLRQPHEKTALLRLAQQFFASGGRSLEQVAYDTAEEWVLSVLLKKVCH